MPLFEGTQQQYYGSQSFIATSGQTAFVLTFPDNQTLLNNLATCQTLLVSSTLP